MRQKRKPQVRQVGRCGRSRELQPTQAFYPSDAAKNEGTVDDADRAAVLAMFTVMRDVVETFAPRLQIVVSDHADLVDKGGSRTR